jgi:hypothetical protein
LLKSYLAHATHLFAWGVATSEKFAKSKKIKFSAYFHLLYDFSIDILL